ncbi:hypothetical protein PGT21_035210 [Puccinia graminis f. sp. tritici]|uniref:Uncharacterized protein n=1 Tax=Puccinia graminis f. sp. tritici TaxID=56615 RepID=A0A5B0P287_PUCGR|nr:hypothetical protein PGT21_035210 [Puccinia graminis f. sp. tritici]
MRLSVTDGLSGLLGCPCALVFKSCEGLVFESVEEQVSSHHNARKRQPKKIIYRSSINKRVTGDQGVCSVCWF